MTFLVFQAGATGAGIIATDFRPMIAMLLEGGKIWSRRRRTPLLRPVAGTQVGYERPLSIYLLPLLSTEPTGISLQSLNFLLGSRKVTAEAQNDSVLAAYRDDTVKHPVVLCKRKNMLFESLTRSNKIVSCHVIVGDILANPHSGVDCPQKDVELHREESR